jgi:signal transduction histidine kinase
VVFFDREGRALASSASDSLREAVGTVDARMLADMTGPDWAFDEIYPDPSNIDAYVNRIFHVAPVTGRDGAVTGYLAGSWRPLVFSEEDVALDPRALWLQAILVGLLASFAVGWVIMTWLTRRIRSLSGAVSHFAAGDLARRVDARGTDEIGQLGRSFNAMAGRLETVIEELRHKELFQRQLIANISHDLRTPLSSLRGYVETLALRGPSMDADEYRRYLTIVTDNVQHLDRLVDHLLQLSRLDAGQTPFRREVFPLDELTEGVLARCAAPAEARSVTLDCVSPDDLPLVEADPLQIGQVLQNLVENGIKFGREGGEVLVMARDAGDGTVEVAVRDDGPGIPLEDQPHIFERFFVGDRSRSLKGQSSGLGLAISAKIVEGHGSELTVESQPGHGACFRFRLPAAAAEPHADEAAG